MTRKNKLEVILRARDIKPASDSLVRQLGQLASSHEKEQGAASQLLLYCKTRNGSPGDRVYDKLLEEQRRKKEMVDDQIKTIIGKSSTLRQQVHVALYERRGRERALTLETLGGLRNEETGISSFRQLMGDLYEHLLSDIYFNYSLTMGITHTPVTEPRRQVVVNHHYTPHDWSKTVVCALLRAALLPSLVVGGGIQEEIGTTPSYALFRVSRSHDTVENLRFLLDPSRTYYDPEELHGKDLIFPDPMLATGGSLIAVYNLLRNKGVKPASITVVSAVSAMKGVLNVVRNIPGVRIYTAAIDPALNDKGYILPGLGDAGDRLNGSENSHGKERGVIELIQNYEEVYQTRYALEIKAIRKIVT